MKNKSLMNLIKTSSFGYAYHKTIFDDDKKPIDYYFLEINKAFEKLTGLKEAEVLNRKITDVFPKIKNSKFDWIAYYGNIALNGGDETIEQYEEGLQRWYKIQVYSEKKGYFSTLFTHTSHMNIILWTLKIQYLTGINYLKYTNQYTFSLMKEVPQRMNP